MSPPCGVGEIAVDDFLKDQVPPRMLGKIGQFDQLAKVCQVAVQVACRQHIDGVRQTDNPATPSGRVTKRQGRLAQKQQQSIGVRHELTLAPREGEAVRAASSHSRILHWLDGNQDVVGTFEAGAASTDWPPGRGSCRAGRGAGSAGASPSPRIGPPQGGRGSCRAGARRLGRSLALPEPRPPQAAKTMITAQHGSRETMAAFPMPNPNRPRHTRIPTASEYLNNPRWNRP